MSAVVVFLSPAEWIVLGRFLVDDFSGPPFSQQGARRDSQPAAAASTDMNELETVLRRWRRGLGSMRRGYCGGVRSRGKNPEVRSILRCKTLISLSSPRAQPTH